MEMEIIISWIYPPPGMPVANEGLVRDSRAEKCNVILVVTSQHPGPTEISDKYQTFKVQISNIASFMSRY